MQEVCYDIAGPKIRYGNPCQEGDVCKDQNAQCSSGRCTCMIGYGADSQGICSKFASLQLKKNYWLLIFLDIYIYTS